LWGLGGHSTWLVDLSSLQGLNTGHSSKILKSQPLVHQGTSAIPDRSKVSAIVFDLSGCKIVTLLNSTLETSVYDLTWLGKNESEPQNSSVKVRQMYNFCGENGLKCIVLWLKNGKLFHQKGKYNFRLPWRSRHVWRF